MSEGISTSQVHIYIILCACDLTYANLNHADFSQTQKIPSIVSSVTEQQEVYRNTKIHVS